MNETTIETTIEKKTEKKTEIKSIVVEVTGLKLSLTMEEARELHKVLDAIFPHASNYALAQRRI